MPYNSLKTTEFNQNKASKTGQRWALNYFFCGNLKQFYWIIDADPFRPACICELRQNRRGCLNIGTPLTNREYFLNILCSNIELKTKIIQFLTAGDYYYYVNSEGKIKILLDAKHIEPTKAMIKNLINL